MFGIFKKKSKTKRLISKYNSLVREAFELSKINRTKSDEKTAEAELILKEIQDLKLIATK